MTRSGCILVALLVACSDATAPGVPASEPLIAGTITGPGWLQGGLLVVAGDGDGCRVSERAQIVVGDSTPVIHRSGRDADGSDLRVGTRVSVWNEGPILESCPAIVHPSVVVIEPR